MSEQPSRYQRSVGGFVGALVIAIAVIVAYVAFRAVTRDDADVSPATVPYREAVAAAQGADWQVLYPASLRSGWRATSIDADPTATWGLGFLTPDGFVGLRQQRSSLDDLLETYVDENPRKGSVVTLQSDVARRWQSWSDSGGDHAISARLGKATVLVYGSAPLADLERFAESLTRDPMG